MEKGVEVRPQGDRRVCDGEADWETILRADRGEKRGGETDSYSVREGDTSARVKAKVLYGRTETDCFV